MAVGSNSFSYSVPPPLNDPFATPPLFKNRELIEQLVELLTDLEPARIVELGIFRGGSVAFTAAFSRPQKIVAFELSDQPLPLLAEFLEREGLAEHVVTCFGVDQGDPEVELIVDREFGSEPIDFVIDDASHLYEPSRRTFEMLFPLIRPGGVYVIEDWASEHTIPATYADVILNRREGWEGHFEQLISNVDQVSPELARRLGDNPAEAEFVGLIREASAKRGGRPLSRLGLELVHIMAETRGIVRSVDITQSWIKVVRGEKAIGGQGWIDLASMDLFGSLEH